MSLFSSSSLSSFPLDDLLDTILPTAQDKIIVTFLGESPTLCIVYGDNTSDLTVLAADGSYTTAYKFDPYEDTWEWPTISYPSNPPSTSFSPYTRGDPTTATAMEGLEVNELDHHMNSQSSNMLDTMLHESFQPNYYQSSSSSATSSSSSSFSSSNFSKSSNSFSTELQFSTKVRNVLPYSTPSTSFASSTSSTSSTPYNTTPTFTMELLEPLPMEELTATHKKYQNKKTKSKSLDAPRVVSFNSTLKEADQVCVTWKDGKTYPAVLKSQLSNGDWKVDFNDSGWDIVSAKNIYKEEEKKEEKKEVALVGVGRWSEEEKKLLTLGVQKYGTAWTPVSEIVGTRTAKQCKSRHRSLDDYTKKKKKQEKEKMKQASDRSLDDYNKKKKKREKEKMKQAIQKFAKAQKMALKKQKDAVELKIKEKDEEKEKVVVKKEPKIVVLSKKNNSKSSKTKKKKNKKKKNKFNNRRSINFRYKYSTHNTDFAGKFK